MNNQPIDDTAAKLAGKNLKIKLADGEILYTNFCDTFTGGSQMAKILINCFDLKQRVDPSGKPIPGMVGPSGEFITIENGVVLLDAVVYIKEL